MSRLTAISDASSQTRVARGRRRRLAGTKDASRCIGYLTKYLTKQLADCHHAATGDQAAHGDRLADTLRYEPCSPTCANWLRYGIQPKNARPGLHPGACKGKAHRPEYLGYAGRRVLVSRKWSGKTLADHRGDRKAWLTEMLGISATDPSRYTWEHVEPGDPDHMPVSQRLLHVVADRMRWLSALDQARRRALMNSPRPKSSLAKERSCLNIYILPVLGNAWIGDLDLPELNETVRGLTLQDGTSASPGTKSTVAAVLRRLFAWAREERIVPVNPALELRTGWGASTRRRILIPSIPQVLRLAEALDHFKPGLGDVAMVMAFTGLRWEEAVAVPIESVDLDDQWITVDRTASESGGRRDIRADMKTRAAERVVAIPDIAMPAVRRLVQRHAAPREQSEGRMYSRLINGERGGYLGYAMWRRYLALAQGYTASHKDGIVKYTAHELRHVCASLLIASGATDMQVANQMGHSRIETTKNIYGHLFAQDRAAILKAMNQAVSRLYVQDEDDTTREAA